MKTIEPPKELQGKKSNSTEFVQCGWCKHASGSHRHNYCIDGTCDLLNESVIWSSNCKIKNLSQLDINSAIDYHKYRIKECEEEITNHTSLIRILRQKQGKNSPVHFSNRHFDHFNVNDIVVVFVESKNKKVKRSGWVLGSVRAGYRHHDGCVSYKLFNEGPQDSGFWGCGVLVPLILKLEEYNYFAENKSEWYDWLKMKESPLGASHTDVDLNSIDCPSAILDEELTKVKLLLG